MNSRANWLQQVMGNDVHRLLDKTGLLHLHAGGGHFEPLARADAAKDPHGLQTCGLEHLNAWAATFRTPDLAAW